MRINLKENRNIILGVGILVAFSLLVLSATSYLNYESSQRFANRIAPHLEGNQTFFPNESVVEMQNFVNERRGAEPFAGFYIIPVSAFVGLLVGVIVYHILSGKIEKQETSLKKNTKIILNFLNESEKQVVEKILEKGGQIEQYELTRLPNINKVKTHRILNALEDKKIIVKHRYGKINKIVLDKELYEVLKD